MPSTPLSLAADRNKQPILEVLRQGLPTHGTALEIASGTGQHVTWFAAAMRGWNWQPSETTLDALAAIDASATRQALANVRPGALIDVTEPDWLPDDSARFDLVYCANMLHIAPWRCCAALMHGSARRMAPGGTLVTYGPYLEADVPTSEGNQAFDRSLRARDPAWGLRHREDVEEIAARAGLQLAARHAMPANNLLLWWTRAENPVRD